MLLRNLRIIENNTIADVAIQDGRINAVDSSIAPSSGADIVINFDDVIAFPGLINSHDHLDFNLFPQYGNKLHNNYVEWGNYIHTHYKDGINKVLQIPQQHRVQWGIYKNLVNGATTVVNHGPHLRIDNPPISIFQQYHLLHSVQLEKYWKYLLNKPFKKKWPFVIHVGEGGDAGSHKEINNLRSWNLYNRDIIGVHGIAMNEMQASFFKAIVWCPASNFFLIGKTAPIDKLKQMTGIAFGTDSTLSAGWNMWDHIRLARNQNMVSNEELYNMLTVSAAKIWNMDNCGRIATNYDADIVIARRKPRQTGFNALYALNPEDILLVMHKGRIRLFDHQLLSQLSGKGLPINNFSKIIINGVIKYVYGDVPALMRSIKNHYKEVEFPFESIEG